MKTLDEIISRQDYVRVNEALVRRASELSEIFAQKFSELTHGEIWWKDSAFPRHSINVNGHMYAVRASRYSCPGGRAIAERINLVRFTDDTWYDEANYSRRYCWEWVDEVPNSKCRKYCLDFLNDAKDILANLDEKETELLKDAEQAIENSKNISL